MNTTTTGEVMRETDGFGMWHVVLPWTCPEIFANADVEHDCLDSLVQTGRPERLGERGEAGSRSASGLGGRAGGHEREARRGTSTARTRGRVGPAVREHAGL